MKNCIYRLTSPSNKIYLGQCKNFKDRIRQHNYLSRNGHSPINRAIRKYGIENFDVDFLFVQETYNRKELNKVEKKLIKELNATDSKVGYNICKGGEGRQGPLSIETRKRMSLAKLGKPSNRKGTHTSDATRKRMSRAHSRPHSEYQKKRIKEGLSIPIEQYTLDGVLIREWKSAKQAILETQIKTVRDVLHGRQKTGGGFIWKYKDKNYVPSSKKRKHFR